MTSHFLKYMHVFDSISSELGEFVKTHCRNHKDVLRELSHHQKMDVICKGLLMGTLLTLGRSRRVMDHPSELTEDQYKKFDELANAIIRSITLMSKDPKIVAAGKRWEEMVKQGKKPL